MKTWDLIDAQDHLEHLFQSALEHRPQRIEPGFGDGAVVMLSADDYTRLAQHELASRQSQPIEAGEFDTERPLDSDEPS